MGAADMVVLVGFSIFTEELLMQVATGFLVTSLANIFLNQLLTLG